MKCQCPQCDCDDDAQYHPAHGEQQCVCDTCQSGNDHCDSATCALPDAPKFQLGQRVICIKGLPGEKYSDKAETWNHIGYYGHITKVVEPQGPILERMYHVHLKGRTGCEAAPWMLNGPWFNPFPFQEDELEAAD